MKLGGLGIRLLDRSQANFQTISDVFEFVHSYVSRASLIWLACLVGVLEAPCDVPGALAVRRRPRVRVSNGYRRE